MSQSDYIRFKKTGIQLQRLGSDTTKLASGQYTAFVDYNTETMVKNTCINYGKQTIPANVVQIFDMKISNAVSCPSYRCSQSMVVIDVSGGDMGGGGG